MSDQSPGPDSLERMLPPVDQRPVLLPVEAIEYPEFLNAAEELLDRNIEQGRADRLAILCGKQRVTYGELMHRVERFAGWLVSLGVTRGDRVLLRLNNNPEFVVAWLSVLRVGGIAVATMPLLRARELRNVLKDSRPKLAICENTLLDEMEQALEARPATQLIVSQPGNSRYSNLQDLSNSGPAVKAGRTRQDDIAILAYTSGSTGQPKGTVHFHRDILVMADTYSRNILRPTEDDVFGGHPTLAFTFGLGSLLAFPFRVGAATSFIDRFTPETMLQATRDFGITLLFCAPTSFKMMMSRCGDDISQYLPRLRLAVSAGEHLPAAVFNAWTSRTGIPILDGIGSTEMLHIFISNRAEDARPDSSGKPVPGYYAKVVDENLNEVSDGVPGLLAVQGPTGCIYLNRPEAQQAYVQAGWNLTGDIYTKDEDGCFHYRGRRDDMIICGGNNIAGPEIEGVLLSHPAVEEVAVVASPDQLRGFVPKAFVVLANEYGPSEQLAAELKEFTKSQIAPYKYPRRIEFVDSLPKTPTGKIRRTELRERELAAFPGDRQAS